MKLNTIQRKKFRVTGKLKKVASSDRLRLAYQDLQKIFQLKLLMMLKTLL